tara:strand:+ start:274 stop:576 length:303 start_codon:yes stop_codon:yes gene_type:complete
MSSIDDIPIPAAYSWEEEELQGIVIEKNIPIPALGTKTGKWQRILSRMDVGDSFVIKLKKDDLKFGRAKQASILAHAAKSLDMKVKTMKISNMLRVWRIK